MSLICGLPFLTDKQTDRQTVFGILLIGNVHGRYIAKTQLYYHKHLLKKTTTMNKTNKNQQLKNTYLKTTT